MIVKSFLIVSMRTFNFAIMSRGSWFNSFMWGFSHVEWEGFSTWDLVMPLFLFMAGVSMPFSLSRYKDMPDKMAVYRRIGKRVLLLWVFGMMCQGN